jgi:dolichyl-diphosphooligosaccharide--protein glycosyltransferase
VLALCAAVLAARVVPAWDVVFPASGEVRLLEIDGYYHLRHARFAAHHFPSLLRFDPGSRFPEGERANAAGLFDLALGAASLLLAGGRPSDATVARVAAWAPALLGALAVAALYRLARGVAGRGTALLACLLFGLYPGTSLGRTLLGFADHHAAEIVLALLCAAGLVRCLKEAQAPAAVPAWRPAWRDAGPLVLFLFTWNGAPLYLGLTALVLLAVGAFELGRGIAARATAVAALRHGAAVLLPTAAAALLRPDLVMEDGSTGLLLACALFAAGPALWLVALDRSARRGVPRALCAAAALALPLLAAGLAASLSESGARAIGFFVGAKSALVHEQKPVGVATLGSLFGPLLLLAAAALPLTLREAWREPRRRVALVPVVFGWLLVALWLAVHDYDYTPPAFLALLAALAAAAALRLVRRSAPRPVAALLALGLLAPVWPLGLVPSPWPAREDVMALRELDEGWSQTLRWMREHTPQPVLAADAAVPGWTGGDLAYPPGSYGVLSSWESGNFVAALARRPAAEARGFREHSFAFFLAESENRALELLCPRCGPGEEIRYVVTDARSLGDYFLAKVVQSGRDLERFRGVWGVHPGETGEISLMGYGEAYRRTLAARLHLRDGSGLGHFRLVYESPQQSFLTYVARPGAGGLEFLRRAVPIESEQERARYAAWAGEGGVVATSLGLLYGGAVGASVKVFERVAGARVTGRAPPGARVEARLALRSLETGRSLGYERTIHAGQDGRFELALAHPTGSAGSRASLRADGPYVLRIVSAGLEPPPLRELEVSEAQVREGARIEIGTTP